MFYIKKEIVFYEKPGCAGNKKQKDLLNINKVEFKVKSILDTKWTKESLNSFFEGLSKDKIINQFAPKIKSREIDIKKYSKDELIELMIKEPILIKRPLIEVDDIKIYGFDIVKLNNALGLKLDTKKEIGICQKDDDCPTLD